MHFTVTRGFHGYFPSSNIIDIVLFYIIRDQVFLNISNNLVLLFFFLFFLFVQSPWLENLQAEPAYLPTFSVHSLDFLLT